MKCLIFDCDGVILESEDLHRRAYNAVFEHFHVQCAGKPVEWDTEFYDVLQNTGAVAPCAFGLCAAFGVLMTQCMILVSNVNTCLR